jgi:hypothetical protein
MPACIAPDALIVELARRHEQLVAVQAPYRSDRNGGSLPPGSAPAGAPSRSASPEMSAFLNMKRLRRIERDPIAQRPKNRAYQHDPAYRCSILGATDRVDALNNRSRAMPRCG